MQMTSAKVISLPSSVLALAITSLSSCSVGKVLSDRICLDYDDRQEGNVDFSDKVFVEQGKDFLDGHDLLLGQ